MQHYLETALTVVTAWAPRIVAALLVLIIGKWIAKGISKGFSRLMSKKDMDPTLSGFLRGIIYYSLLVMVFIAAAAQLGVNTTSFLTIVGAAGLAVGLALKDSLSNFASGVMLVIFRPFKVGDVVSAGGVTGKIDKINIFNTIMLTPDNQVLIVPNSAVTAGVITNITANPTRRVDLVFGIGYGDDIQKAREIIAGLLREDDRVLKDPAPQIAVSELADSSVNFVVRPWTKTEDYWGVYFDLQEKVKVAFDEAGINIPYPQQDVHVFTVEKN